jgi:hypothetical protein
MQSLNDSWGRTASQNRTTRDVAAQTWSSTAQFAESRKIASTESERLAKEADRAETISETVRGSRSNEFFRFAMGDGTTPGYFRFEPQTGRERSDSEIAALLQGRDELSQQRLADGVEVFMKRYPAPQSPALIGEVSNDVREPQVLGVGPDVERSFEDSKSALTQTSDVRTGNTAKRDLDASRARVVAPDADRTVISPTAGAEPLTPKVDQALARGDLLKKPAPVAMPKPPEKGEPD